MFKRIIIFALLPLFLFSLFTGCAHQDKADKSPVTLTLWHYYNHATKDIFDTLVQTYNETVGREKGILVDARAYSGVDELADAVFASAKGEVGAADMPDIFAAYSDNAYRLDELGKVASLDAYFTPKERAAYRAEFLEEGCFGSDGSLKIVPVAKSTELFYLNDTDFSAFASAQGISYEQLSTWEGLAATAASYYAFTDAQTETPNDGRALFGIDSFANFMNIAARQMGEQIFVFDDGKQSFALSRETAKRIWDLLYVPYLSGHYASLGRFRSDDIRAGELLCYVGSTSSAKYFLPQVERGRDNAYSIEARVLPYPHVEGGEKIAVQQGAGLVVGRSDERREAAAVDFLKWFAAPEQNLVFSLSTGYMPVQNEALASDLTPPASSEAGSSATPAVLATSIALKTALENYTLYAAPPFAKSFESRKILDNSLPAQIESDRALLQAGLARGEDRATLIGELASEQNFDIWFASFAQEMSALVD